MIKHPEQYSVEDVCALLVGLDLGAFVPVVNDNNVEGGLLCSLTQDDMKSDLGMTGLEAKRLLRGLDFATQIATAEPGGGGGGGEAIETLEKRIALLESENKELREENRNLKAALAPPPAPTPAPAPAPAPAPVQKAPPPPPPPCGAPIIREGAKGAAKGVILGTVAGAVAGNAGKGAKMGAAVGATSGGMRGIGERRRAHMVRRF